MSILSLNFNQLVVPSGNQVWLRDINWAMFEGILEKLGETRGIRLAYQGEMLEIMSPLARHEDDKSIVGRLVEVLLEEMAIEFRALGSTTFKNKHTGIAVEPDDCFYIEHETVIRGKARIDLEQDPPPDLVLEIDLTSHTRLDIYAALKVPEVWRYTEETLHIYTLNQGHYVEVQNSPHFPGLAVREAIPKFLASSRIHGRTTAIKAFRVWVKNALNTN